MLARLLAVAAVLLVFAAVAVYGVFGANVWRWGCPSQAELERLRTPVEVEAAFRRSGLELVRTAWRRELRGARPYRGALVFRHSAKGATLYVLVCEVRCGISRGQLRHGTPRERFRFGFAMGNNVAGWIAGDDRRAAARLRHALSEPLAELDAGVDPDSRCYIG
jgi:hypothetical protein